MGKIDITITGAEIIYTISVGRTRLLKFFRHLIRLNIWFVWLQYNDT